MQRGPTVLKVGTNASNGSGCSLWPQILFRRRRGNLSCEAPPRERREPGSLLKGYPQTALSRIGGLPKPPAPSSQRARSSPDAVEQIYTVVTRVGRGLYNQIYLDASMCEMRSRHLDE